MPGKGLQNVQDYFDAEIRKHPSFLLFDTSPANFLVPSETYARELLGDFDTGLKILEIGSGDSIDSLTLAASNNHVWAIDIATRRLSLAHETVRESGKLNQVLPTCMDAHQLGFPDNYFDLVVGNSVLLFLDKESFASECYRVLKPGGRALFSHESMNVHPLLVVRRLLPGVRNRESLAHRITLRDIAKMAKQLDGVEHRQFYLLSVLFAPIAPRFGHLRGLSKAIGLAHRIDSLLLRLIPALRGICWVSVAAFRKNSTEEVLVGK